MAHKETSNDSERAQLLRAGTPRPAVPAGFRSFSRNCLGCLVDLDELDQVHRTIFRRCPVCEIPRHSYAIRADNLGSRRHVFFQPSPNNIRSSPVQGLANGVQDEDAAPQTRARTSTIRGQAPATGSAQTLFPRSLFGVSPGGAQRTRPTPLSVSPNNSQPPIGSSTSTEVDVSKPLMRPLEGIFNSGGTGPSKSLTIHPESLFSDPGATSADSSKPTASRVQEPPSASFDNLIPASTGNDIWCRRCIERLCRDISHTCIGPSTKRAIKCKHCQITRLACIEDPAPPRFQNAVRQAALAAANTPSEANMVAFQAAFADWEGQHANHRSAFIANIPQRLWSWPFRGRKAIQRKKVVVSLALQPLG